MRTNNPSLDLQTIEEITNKLTGTAVPSALDRGTSNSVNVNVSLPSSLDWRDKGLVSEVKMQVSSGQVTLIFMLEHKHPVEGYLTSSFRVLVALAGPSVPLELWKGSSRRPQVS